MTAQAIIDSTKPLLNQLSIQDKDDILLTYVNLAKNQIAQDTMSWLGGEEIDMTTASNYTLSVVPIQILDIYDERMNIVRRNSPTSDGYYQTSPNTIKVVTPRDGEKLYINYYYTPNDYILTDEVIVPSSLINAIQYFIAHKSFENYKTEKEMFSSTEYFKKYRASITDYISATDTLSTDTIIGLDVLSQKNLI